MTTLTAQQIADARLTGWVNLGDGLRTRVRTGDFATGLALVEAIGAVAEEVQHHPDLDLRYAFLDVRLVSHDAGGVTARDVALARTVTDLVARMGAALDGAAVQRFDLALDTPERAGVQPFWRALLGYEDTPGQDDEVRDPAGGLPAVWFQESGAGEPRQRWHLDVWVDPSAVAGRVEAATAAGGTLVDDTAAPSFWVLADPEGNRSCLCTWQSRDAGADGPAD
ncbi:VOC family protein [Cellulomonas sp. SLBN-39]|uniref:VOC family protein n=1 Tax=Cellulomonas sp. SLBN-39 TaxID=2768446 RepID=UPI00114EACAC|nr:VOC family protein [Cellulomonas sp. SLBN-39]TQL01353.1 4a-hydroxytetrahydrobiopterin dehydratase [Cellulomonas sp. SLBN-39]